jgi:hypothetical protein
MRRFRCFFIDERGLRGFEPIDLEDEAEAVRRAENMLRWRASATSAELWESGRLVAQVKPSRDI